MSCGSLRSGPDQSKVLDPQLGWSDFRSDYGSASWRWLAAATRARWLSWDTIVSHTSHSIIRLLLMSGSMSEPSLVKIAGLIMKLSHGCDKTVVLAEVVGVRRESIKVLFKNPSRMNVFLQIREVDKIETTSVSVWFLSWHEKQLGWRTWLWIPYHSESRKRILLWLPNWINSHFHCPAGGTGTLASFCLLLSLETRSRCNIRSSGNLFNRLFWRLQLF